MSEFRNRVRVTIGGSNFADWEAIDIQRSILSAAGGFQLIFADRQLNQRFPFAKGDPIEIRYGDEQVITGFIEQISKRWDAKEVETSISGRDATGDLIDSSYDPDGPTSFENKMLDQIVTALVKPFGIPVTFIPGPGLTIVGKKFARFVLKPSESAWEAIDRALKLRGFIAFSPGDGSLLVTTAGTIQADAILAEGQNIVGGSMELSDVERFSKYVAVSHRFGSDLDWASLAQIGTRGPSEFDLGITRFRPKLVLVEEPTFDDIGQLRVRWEKNTRAAEASKLKVVVAGWSQQIRNFQLSPLWRENMLVQVEAPTARISDRLLIQSVRYLSSNLGTFTEIDLVRKEALEQEPLRDEKGDPFQLWLSTTLGRPVPTDPSEVLGGDQDFDGPEDGR